MNGAIRVLLGQVMHERSRPVVNRFVYPVFCLRLNLDHESLRPSFWFAIDRWRPLSLNRKDYGPRDGSALLPWIQTLLHQAGIEADGEVHLQTFPRVFGYAFNPVSFWYCRDKQGQLRAVLAEVNNTFGEHHRYLLTTSDGAAIHAGSELVCRKTFHVSPFCRVAGHYRFCFIEQDGSAFVGIDYHDDDGLLIKTSIAGRLAEGTPDTLRRALCAFPALTFGVVLRIHWQALRLWCKRVPFFRKPAPPAASISYGSEIHP